MIGLVLAGGRASRLGGGDKGARCVGGLTILDRVLAILAPHCDALLINGNGDPARFGRHGHRVIADDLPGRPGPLAGILAGLDAVAALYPEARYAVSAPADAPFLPPDLVPRLVAGRSAGDAAIVCAASGGRTHHVTALWSVALRHDLRRALVEEGLDRVATFVARHAMVRVPWPDTPYDPFFNVNTPGDLAEAERLAARFG